jgi:hypothetical protein
MTVTSQEITAAVSAAEAYEGWESGFIGETNNENMARLIIETADASPDQSVAGRQSAAVAALTKTIDAAGYGSEVSATMINGVVSAVLGAITGLDPPPDSANNTPPANTVPANTEPAPSVNNCANDDVNPTYPYPNFEEYR